MTFRDPVARTTRSSRPSSALDGWSNHARQVRSHRCHRQGAQAQQHEPCLFALSLDPFRRAPADQARAQGHLGLQPRGMGRKPCAGRAQDHSLAQGTVCRGHRDPRDEASVISFPKVKSHELASCFNCGAGLQRGSRAATRYPWLVGVRCRGSTIKTSNAEPAVTRRSALSSEITAPHILAALNKSLAGSNNSRTDSKETKKHERRLQRNSFYPTSARCLPKGFGIPCVRSSSRHWPRRVLPAPVATHSP